MKESMQQGSEKGQKIQGGLAKGQRRQKGAFEERTELAKRLDEGKRG